LMLKDKNRCLDADFANLFSIIALVLISVFYIFYIRGAEDRWVFLWMPFIFFMIANAIKWIYKMTIRNNKNAIAIAIVIGILLFGGYAQLNHANSIIESKKDSYSQVKDAAVWMKSISPVEAKILSISYTQTVYYSERNVSTYSGIKSAAEFEEYLNATRPDLLVVSVFEPHPQWIYDYVQQNNQTFRPINAYFMDAAQTQLALVIYGVNNDRI